MSEVEEGIENFSKQTGIRPFDADWIKNSFVNSITFGTVGYDSDTGKFTKGELLRATDETIGELTGRNAAREEIYKANVRLDKESQTREAMRIADLKKKSLEDSAASNRAGMVRKSAAKRSPVYTDALNPEKDFLGL